MYKAWVCTNPDCGFNIRIDNGEVSFGKVNVDENPKTASQYGIMSIPTLIVFKDGKPHSNIVGFRPKDELKKSLDAAIR